MSNVLHSICHEQICNKVVYAEGAIIALFFVKVYEEFRWQNKKNIIWT